MPDDDASKLLGLDAAQEFFEAQHVLERARSGIRARGHDLRKGEHGCGHKHGRYDKRQRREHEHVAEPHPDREQHDAQRDAPAFPFIANLIRSTTIEPALGQTRVDRVADAGELFIKLVLQIGQLHRVAVAVKDAVEHLALVGGETVRGRGLEPVQRVVDASVEQTEELGILMLLDAEITAHREIHERCGDVTHIGRRVHQRPSFGRRQAGGRVVLDSDRPAARIPAATPPGDEGDKKYRNRNQQRPIVARDSEHSCGETRRGDDPFIPSHDRGEPFVVCEGMRHRDSYSAAADFDI